MISPTFSDTLTDTPSRATLFDYPVDVLTPNQALQRAIDAVAQQHTLQVVTLNPEMLMAGDDNPALGVVLKQAGLVLPDGAGLVWALKHRRLAMNVQRLPGIEFAENVLAYAAKHQWRVAIIGAAPEVLAQAVDRLRERFVGLNLVYTQHGFFQDAMPVIQACEQAKPQLVLAALGVPRQELFLANDLLPRLSGGVVGVGLGGSLDVWSGVKKRAPAVFRALNLEWLYRITSEPWRIQRVAKPLPTFLWRVLSAS
jgi:N-acetylglucosaminyldiphosphoundecaprenol N-acetyl-beta-D-mannosaminyltransferase